ncbi:MAG: hypothetical protein MUC43_14080, partial [Pirellula sp.]|nr:hypothetical protein [Pirellula sp.]
GTGFRIFQDSEVSYRREALEDLVNRGTVAVEESFPLLNQAPRPADEPIAPKPSVVLPSNPIVEETLAPESDDQPSGETASAPSPSSDAGATPEE